MNILLVDDEKPFLQATHIFLQEKGYNSIPFHDPKHIDINSLPNLQCAIIDWNLPNIPGIELYSLILQKFQALPVIFISGFDIELTNSLQLLSNYTFMVKPFTLEELVNTIRDVVTC